MLALLSVSLASESPTPNTTYPFPQDCSNYNKTTRAPSWFSNCTAAAGGCFNITIPTETEFNVGNTTFGASSAGGTEWCIDHLQGFVYSRVVDPVGAMFYEVDDRVGTGNAPQCRFLTGFDGRDADNNPIYEVRTYVEAGLLCYTTLLSDKDGIRSYDLRVTKTVRAPVKAADPPPPPYPFPQDCSNVNASTGTPGWFSNCSNVAGGCFKISIPTETDYNVGNTTFGASSAGGTQWCIDHLQGFVYSKVIDPYGAMYFEIDGPQTQGLRTQCRFLTGADGTDSTGAMIYHTRVYNEAGLTCTFTLKNSTAGVTLGDMAVSPTPTRTAVA